MDGQRPVSPHGVPDCVGASLGDSGKQRLSRECPVDLRLDADAIACDSAHVSYSQRSRRAVRVLFGSWSTTLDSQMPQVGTRPADTSLVETNAAEPLFDSPSEGPDDFDTGETVHDPLKLYVRAIGDGRLLTPVEERELARRKDEGDEVAKRKLIESNLRLVMSITRNYTRADVPLLDLIQEGNLGLMRPSRSSTGRWATSSTYATWWIRQAVQRALAEQSRTIRLPVHIADQVRRVQRAGGHWASS